jgi:hypothetical protein
MVENEGSAIAQEFESLSPDALLRMSRRVDWRFLLPSPHLGDVAYIGVNGPMHLDSLRLFSNFLTNLDSIRTSEKNRREFDGIVLSEPSYEILRRATNLVKSGGFIYLEVRKPLNPVELVKDLYSRMRKGFPRLIVPGDYLLLFEELGFTEVQANWHWPSFQACTKIIPINNESALDYAFLQSGRSTKARLKAILGHWLQRSGLLWWVLPCFSVVAVRDGD